LLSGCVQSRIVWSTETRSPDRNWLAIAQTVQVSGPGNNGAYTSVYLKWTDNSKKYEILQKAETGSIDLKLKWASPSDLDITYNGYAATIWLQVIKYGKVNIHLQDLSRVSTHP
jgi:hypothetical protein